MTDRVIKRKKELLEVKPTLSIERLRLETEAARRYTGLPTYLYRARILEYILLHKTVHIWDGELIVGSVTDKLRGADIFPEYSSGKLWLYDTLPGISKRASDPFEISEEDVAEAMELLKFWEGKATEERCLSLIPQYLKDRENAGIFHSGNKGNVSGEINPNYPRLFAGGFRAQIERCRERIAEAVDSGMTVDKMRQVEYWQATVIILEAMITYSHRLADEAKRQAEETRDEHRRAELLQIEKTCRRVPEFAPRTFREALQFQFLVEIGLDIEANSYATGLGRFDVNLGPYYERDLAEGILTEDEAKELLELFFIKVTANVILSDNYYARADAGYPMWQILMIGGVDREGRDVTNALSYLVLDAASEVRLAQPAIALRVHDHTPEPLYQKAVSMIQEGQANPAFFSDKVAMKQVMYKGGSLEEARDWVIIGCVEPHPGVGNTDGSPVGGYVSLPKCVELVLHNGTDPVTGKKLGLETGDPAAFTCREQLVEAVKKQLCYEWELLTREHCISQSVQKNLPAIYASSLIDGCIEKGTSIQEGGPVHCYVNMFVCGSATAGDSIAAIDYAVFQKHLLTMEELIYLCDTNFENAEDLRLMLVNRAPKFGNDNPDVDAMVSDIVAAGCEFISKIPDARGGRFSPGNLSQTNNVTLGEHVGATPDGRKAFTALSDNASPSMGRDTTGPTASANSVAHLNQEVCGGGVLYNLRFDPRGVQGEKGRVILGGIIREFLEGGEHIQINVVDDKTLRAAQEKPEEYRDLVVRVAGYMAYFTELDKGVQDVIIARTAHQIA